MVMDFYLVFMISLFFVSLFYIFVLHYHYMNCILILEIISFDMFFMIGYLLNVDGFYLLMYFIVIIVCESVFGLSILVNNFRLYSLSNFSLCSFSLC